MTGLICAFRVNVKALRKCVGTSDTSSTNFYKSELHYTKSTASMYASENQAQFSEVIIRHFSKNIEPMEKIENICTQNISWKN